MFDTSKIGYSFPPFVIEVERCKIRELAQAIGDENPMYRSQEAAMAAGYEDVPLSPTTPTIFNFWGNPQLWDQLVGVGLNVKRILHGEEEYRYLIPIYPGDILTGVTTIVEGKTRHGKDGSSTDIVTAEIRYTNQQQKPVLTARMMLVVRE
jgi:acyl dehydratase